jgi:hypothetical protein
MNISSTLGKKLSELEGRQATSAEKERLHGQFPSMSIKALIDLISRYPVIECDFSLSESQDVSGFGVDMKWLSPDEMIDAALNFYPGISARTYLYLPIGECTEGSGDPYFIDTSSKDLAVVRIPHDAVDEELNLSRERVEVVALTLLNFFELSLGNESL